MKKVKLKYNDIINIVKTLVTEQDDQYVKMDASKVKEYLGYVSYKGEQLRRFPEIRGKKIYVVGKLDLRGTDIDTLGPIAKSDNIVDVSNTKLRSFGDWEDKEHRVYFYGTPYYWAGVKKNQNVRRNLNIGYIEDGKIGADVDTDFSNKHYAVFKHLSGDDSFDVLDDEEQEELNMSRKRLEEYENQLSDLDKNNENYSERFDELKDIISEIEGRISELEEKISIEDIYIANHYRGGSGFEILKLEHHNVDGVVGTEREMEYALLEYAKQYIDDVSVQNMNRSFVEDYIDVDRVIDQLDFENDVRDNPDSYLDDSDRELSKAQKYELYKKQKQVKIYQIELETMKEHNSRYDELKELIEELMEEIEEINSNPEGDYNEDRIRDVIDDRNDEIKRDPLSVLRDYGFDPLEFIDKDALAKGLADSEGYGFMATYDGSVDSERINGTDYYIFFTNK